MSYYSRSYQSVSQRAAKSQREAKKLAKRLGRELRPAPPDGESWGQTPWGRMWIEYIESLSRDSARASRGRSYAKNGSVIDVEFLNDRLFAKIVGSEMYTAELAFGPLDKLALERLRRTLHEAAGTRSALVRGEPDAAVMALVMRYEPEGLLPKRIHTGCTCYDWGELCKHRLAVLYGLGGMLDADPGVLFELRGIDFQELSGLELERALNLDVDWSKSAYKALDDDDLGELFGVDLILAQVEEVEEVAPPEPPRAALIKAAQRAQLDGEELLLVGFIMKEPGVLKDRLARLVGLSAKALKPKLDRLVELGLVECPGGKGFVMTDLGFEELWRFF